MDTLDQTIADQFASTLASGMLRQELASARSALGLARSHLEQAYAMSGTLGVSPADRLAIHCAHKAIKESLAHLSPEAPPRSADNPVCVATQSEISNHQS